MKKIFKMMALLLCLTATAGMIGCSKDDSSSSDSGNANTQNSLSGTKWVSSIHYDYGDYQPTETKELSFTSENRGTYHRHLDTGSWDSEDETVDFTYTYSSGYGQITMSYGGTSYFSVNGDVLTWQETAYSKQ